MDADLFRRAVGGQYEAALAMIEGAVSACPADEWGRAEGGHPFWQVAVHALFYADLYLSPSEEAFRRPDPVRPDDPFLGHRPWPPFERVAPGPPLPRESVEGLAARCRGKLRRVLREETEATLAGPSGFPWLPFPRAELHLYGLRHLQHHAGQLNARLRAATGKGVDWIATRGPA